MARETRLLTISERKQNHNMVVYTMAKVLAGDRILIQQPRAAPGSTPLLGRTNPLIGAHMTRMTMPWMDSKSSLYRRRNQTTPHLLVACSFKHLRIRVSGIGDVSPTR